MLQRTGPDQSQPAHGQACIPQTWAEGDLVHPDFCHLQGCFGDSHGGLSRLGWEGCSESWGAALVRRSLQQRLR